jgi:hypothetical protein
MLAVSGRMRRRVPHVAPRHRRCSPLQSDVVTVKQGQQLPDSWLACILLGDSAPAVQGSADLSWQTEVIKLLQERWSENGRLVVLLQGSSPGTSSADGGDGWAGWDDRAVGIADAAAYWWPDGADLRLMSTTLSAWQDSRRVIYGVLPGPMHATHILRYANRHSVSTAASLVGMAKTILEKIGSGAYRRGGERDVPLSIWRTDSFRRWYKAQTAAGNKLVGARLVWTFNVGNNAPFLLYWALHVRMNVVSEDRIKTNEVVISRPDISVMALYRPGPSLDDTIIVLIREFRSPASTPDGLVHELPGGSGSGDNQLDQVVRETGEEVGLAIDRRRVRAYGSRQLAATVSAHQAHLFAAEITDEELSLLRSVQSVPHGKASDTEQTWTEIRTFREIRQSRFVDWATVGMITDILLDQGIC